MRAVTTEELALGAPLSRLPESRDLGLGRVWAGENVDQSHGEHGIQVVPEHPAGGRVGFDEAALRIDNQNRVRNTFEQTPEPDLCFLGLETGGPLGVEQTRVVDRQRGAAGQLLLQLQVTFVVAIPRFRRYEGDHANRTLPGNHRHEHYRGEPNQPQDGEVLGVAGCRDEHLVGHLREDLGEPRARDADYALVGVGVDRVLLLQPARPGNPLGIGVGDRELGYRPVLPDQVDDTPVGETRHGEPRDVRQRRFDVKRGGEGLSRFGQESLSGFGPLLRGGILPDIDRVQDIARGISHRRGADNRPALFAGLVVAEAEGNRGLGLALEGPATRQVLYRERLAFLVQEGELPHDLSDRCGKELGRTGKP